MALTALTGDLALTVVVWYGALLGWLVAEGAFQRAARRRGAPKWHRSAQDRGTFVVVIASLYLGVSVPFSLYVSGWVPRWPSWLLLPGLALVALGIAVRGSALRTLGRNFSLVVETTADQQLVRDGLYRWIRHPSYLANLLVVAGLALVAPTWVGLVAGSAIAWAGHLTRIRVEERALRDRFPGEYGEYARTTWRLIPGVY